MILKCNIKEVLFAFGHFWYWKFYFDFHTDELNERKSPFIYFDIGRRAKLQNMICSTIKIRPAYKISVLYLQNQASYSNFSLVNVMRNLNLTIFSNPEISLKFWDFGLNFCMWPLNIQTNKCYIATWCQR